MPASAPITLPIEPLEPRIAPAGVIRLGELDGSDGFKILAARPFNFENVGYSISAAGDLNGDGFGDVIVGSFTNFADAAYVVFGHAGEFAPEISPNSLDGSNGFVLVGETYAVGGLGLTVSGVGDINGDGFDDILTTSNGEGEYVVFGKAGAFDARVNVTALDGSDGFRIIGAHAERGIGASGAGDFNGDGVDDLLIGARGLDDVGGAYVIFGHTGSFSAEIDVADLDASEGLALVGPPHTATGHYTGSRVAAAGDINGDGFDDVCIGLHRFPIGGHKPGGQVFVVFGRADVGSPSLDLATLDSENGFRLQGRRGDSGFGGTIAGVGDLNGDGFDEIAVGRLGVGADKEKRSYVIYGRADGFAPIAKPNLAGWPEATVLRDSGRPFSSPGRLAGSDIDGDGFSDLIVGGCTDSRPAQEVIYILYGKAEGLGPKVNVSKLGAQTGLALLDDQPGKTARFGVSPAGDVNGDGFNDVLIGGPGADNAAGEAFVVFGFAAERAPDPQLLSSIASATVTGQSSGLKLARADGAPLGDTTRFRIHQF